MDCELHLISRERERDNNKGDKSPQNIYTIVPESIIKKKNGQKNDRKFRVKADVDCLKAKNTETIATYLIRARHNCNPISQKLREASLTKLRRLYSKEFNGNDFHYM